MDPNALIEALRGTMDPNLREAAERQLNEVKTCGFDVVVVAAARAHSLSHTHTRIYVCVSGLTRSGAAWSLRSARDSISNVL